MAERKPYFEKLKDPRWQKRRLQVLENANWSCQDCGSTEIELHVHHCAYLQNREPWEYNSNTLMALCKPCHEKRQMIENMCRLYVGGLFRQLSQTDLTHLLELLRSFVLGLRGFNQDDTLPQPEKESP